MLRSNVDATAQKGSLNGNFEVPHNPVNKPCHCIDHGIAEETAIKHSKHNDHHLKEKTFEPLTTDFKYEFARAINLAWFKTFHCIRYRAVNNIPKTGPMIVAPNHVSFYDPTGVAAGIPFRVRFMAWDALFKVPILRSILLGWGAYPVKLKSADKGAIKQTLKILHHGEAVIIFPEGIRNEDGSLAAFEQGPARLAVQTGAAIIPAAIVGSFEAWPSSRALPNLFVPLNVKYYPPVYAHDLPPDMDMKDKVAEMNRRVAAPIRRRLQAWTHLKSKKL